MTAVVEGGDMSSRAQVTGEAHSEAARPRAAPHSRILGVGGALKHEAPHGERLVAERVEHLDDGLAAALAQLERREVQLAAQRAQLGEDAVDERRRVLVLVRREGAAAHAQEERRQGRKL